MISRKNSEMQSHAKIAKNAKNQLTVKLASSSQSFFAFLCASASLRDYLALFLCFYLRFDAAQRFIGDVVYKQTAYDISGK